MFKLWDAKTTQDIFEQLGRTIGTRLINAENATREALLNTETKIAVLADIHGNLHALKAVLHDAQQRGIGIFLNAGDLTGFGVFPNEVIKLLNSKKTVSVIGNFDLEMLEETRERQWRKETCVKVYPKGTKQTVRRLSAQFTPKNNF